MRSHLSVLIGIGVLVTLVGCRWNRMGEEPPPPLPAADQVVHYGVPVEPLTLRTGQTLLVTVPSAPATAHFWHVEGKDTGVLRLTDHGYVADPQTRDMAGGGGTDTFLFRGEGQGATAFELVERSSVDNQAARRMTMRVTVTEPDPR